VFSNGMDEYRSSYFQVTMWCVVHFAEENSVEVVPVSWHDSGVC
jgi:hypothetical protein